MANPPLLTLIFLLLLALDLAAAATRAAFIFSSHTRLIALREALDAQVSRTVSLLRSLPRLKAALSLTLVLTRFGLAGLLVYGLTGVLQSWAVAGVLLALGFLVFAMEWVAERWVLRSPEGQALRLHRFGRVLLALWSVALFWLPAAARPDQPDEDNAATITDELKSMVDFSREEGVIEQDEQRMIFSVIQLSNTLAREIMAPRIDILALDVDTPIETAIGMLVQRGYSRVPVYKDTIDNLLGILYAKEFLRYWEAGHELDSLRPLLRPAYFVPEAKRVGELLAEMQVQQVHMAVVVDEYGGVAGLVTLEDIVEEILGDIRDEYDQEEEQPFLEISEGEFLFQGRVDLDDFNEVMSSDLASEEAESLGGYIYAELGRVPAPGEEIVKGSLLLTVDQVVARRIRKVRARWLPEDEPVDAPKENKASHANGRTASEAN